MGRKANPTIVGVFVLSSLAIVIALIIALTSNRFFVHPHKFVLFFNTNVEGLNVGAPVKFRGVEIGAVTNVALSLGGSGNLQRGSEVPIPVIVELDSGKILAGGAELDLDDPKEIRTAIRLGLRGSLALSSFLTGLRYVELTIHPNTPIKYCLGSNSPYPEIPTIQAPLEQAQTAVLRIMSSLEKVNLQPLIDSLTQTSDTMRGFMKSEELHKTIASFDQAAVGVDQAAASIKNTSDSLDQQVQPTAEDLRQTGAAARVTLQRAQDTLAALKATLGPGSPASYELVETLEQTTAAVRSMRQLLDYLERDPSSLIRGRYVKKDGK